MSWICVVGMNLVEAVERYVEDDVEVWIPKPRITKSDSSVEQSAMHEFYKANSSFSTYRYSLSGKHRISPMHQLQQLPAGCMSPPSDTVWIRGGLTTRLASLSPCHLLGRRNFGCAQFPHQSHRKIELYAAILGDRIRFWRGNSTAGARSIL